jgi:hypothetical protein
MTERTGTNMDADPPWELWMASYWLVDNPAFDLLPPRSKDEVQTAADPNYQRDPILVLPRNRPRKIGPWPRSIT